MGVFLLGYHVLFLAVSWGFEGVGVFGFVWFCVFFNGFCLFLVTALLNSVFCGF